jgi:hypothetical protein
MNVFRIILPFMFFLIALGLSAETNKPIVLFKDQTAKIEQGGKPIAWLDGGGISDSRSSRNGSKNGIALAGWEDGFRKKFNENFPFMVNQLESDLVQVKLQSQGGGNANFEVNIYVFCIHDCEPCKGDDAVSEEYLVTFLEFVDPVTNRILHIEKTEATFIIEGEPNLKESVERAWSEFLRSFIKDDKLKSIIKDITYITDATITFRAKDSSDELPMKADGKKKGVVKISLLKSDKAEFPVGEIDSNPLTEFELSCKNGLLVDEDGSEVKKIKFKGSEYVAKRDNFEFDYVVYSCDDNCDKYDVFTLKLKSQNGENLIREVAVKKEEFACYGYTISLEYNETNELTGTTKISATWECVKIDFGKPGQAPVEMDMNAAMTGEALDTNGDPLLPPYTIQMATENGLIHVSAPIKNNTPASYSFSSTGGAWEEFAGSFRINFDEDYLTNPPELIWVKSSVAAEELCGGVLPAGVYLEWQFDIWGDLPELGYSQLYQPAATSCPLLSNVMNSTIAKVPENVIPSMKDGKAFTFTNSNDFGSYTITGIPQQQ